MLHKSTLSLRVVDCFEAYFSFVRSSKLHFELVAQGARGSGYLLITSGRRCCPSSRNSYVGQLSRVHPDSELHEKDLGNTTRVIGMSVKVYFGGLPETFTEDKFRQLLASQDVGVPDTDTVTIKPGYGFAIYDTESVAKEAIAKFNGESLLNCHYHSNAFSRLLYLNNA